MVPDSRLSQSRAEKAVTVIRLVLLTQGPGGPAPGQNPASTANGGPQIDDMQLGPAATSPQMRPETGLAGRWSHDGGQARKTGQALPRLWTILNHARSPASGRPRRGSGQAAAASRPGRRPGASVRRSTLKPMLNRSLAKPAQRERQQKPPSATAATPRAARRRIGRAAPCRGKPAGSTPHGMQAGGISIVEVFTNTGFRRH